MLFNSTEFLFLFLPGVLILFYAVVARLGLAAMLVWLAITSLAFYAWDAPERLLPIILGSIAFNFIIGRKITQTRSPSLLTLGIVGNLSYLGYFKYAGLFTDIFDQLFNKSIASPKIALPIGISFFTFTQIAFLVDAYKGSAKTYGPVSYGLFVSFFPHLIAGPIYHHNDIIPQFLSRTFGRFNSSVFALGLTWFSFGLAKKVLLADSLIHLVAWGFKPAANGGIGQIPVADAWIAVASYTLQIYFDFSGYSDMAIGLALMLGITFPLNFNSPYKADSLIDFWHRWHMTLSRFLRDYLYINLGGNRRGKVRKHLNLLITMVLGGLWHGASYNFLIWGGMHGLGLVTNHVWRETVKIRVPRYIAKALTLFFVMMAWVPFRSETLTTTMALYNSMFPATGISLAGSSTVPTISALIWVSLLFAIALFAPNTQEILSVGSSESSDLKRHWKMTTSWALSIGLLLGAAIAFVVGQQRTEFLYFRF